MKKYMVKEIVEHYHEVEIDDELNIEEIITKASRVNRMYDTGYAAIEATLQWYQDHYGFEFAMKSNACGTDSIEMDVVDELC